MRLYFTITLLFIALSLHAQDPSFSQFYANRIYLNPALAALDPGITVSGNYRMQWRNVDNGFQTYVATVEIQEPFIRSGFGLSIYQDVQGLPALTTTGAGLTYAYTLPMERHSVHFGMQANWFQKTVDFDKIVFSDELDPVYGDIYQTSFDSGLDRSTYTDFNIGAVWRFKGEIKVGKKRYRDTHNSLGITLNHATNVFRNGGSDESLLNLETPTPPRITVHAGSIIPLAFVGGSKKKTVSISPNFKYDVQGQNVLRTKENLQVFTYGFYLLYEGIYMGAMYQHKFLVSAPKHTNAFIFSFGAHIDSNPREGNKFFIGFSYDANTTGLGTTAGGVYELAFRWTFGKGLTIFGGSDGRSSRKPMDCYHFF
ncbi:MAG: PorP/SprF family type IX secretion system membrane protein [Bacteroidota bacterium]